MSRFERLVFAVPLRLGLTRDDANDVTQATFLSLFEQLDRIEDPSRLPSWLMTVARRASWRMIERSRREATEAGRAREPVSDQIEEWELVAWMHETVESMPEPCRTLLISLFLDPEQPSYEVVAARIGRSPGSIGPMRTRCLATLRERLEAELDEAGAHERA